MQKPPPSEGEADDREQPKPRGTSKKLKMTRTDGSGRSSGELRIAQLLSGLDVLVLEEMWWKQCRGDHQPLRFDFFVVVNGRAGVIEFDGEQHFRTVVTPTFIMTEEGLAQRKDYDLRKNRFCRDRGISMLRVSHAEQDQVERWVTDYVRDLGAARTPIFRFSSALLYVNPFGEDAGRCAVC
jgi:hypothetical protein